MTILAFLNALLSILAPIVSVLVAHYVEQQRKEAPHVTVDEMGMYIKGKINGDRDSLALLSRQLERLRREAQRKLRHP